MNTVELIRRDLQPGEKAVILTYGSSNTERFLPGMHWCDILELALRDTYGRFHQCINTGLCGDTSRGLLQRFEKDAARFHPKMVILTIGGNDRDPVHNIPPEQFALNLRDLQRRFADIGCRTVFQTYYAVDPARIGDLGSFHCYMDLVRQAAHDTGSDLVDHLVRWEAFQQAYPERYLDLMLDGFHVNPGGNTILGHYLSRHVGAKPASTTDTFWDEALSILQLMDELENSGK